MQIGIIGTPIYPHTHTHSNVPTTVSFRVLVGIFIIMSAAPNDGPKYGRRAAPGADDAAGGDAPRPVVKGWGEDTVQLESTISGNSGNVTSVNTSDPVDLPVLDGAIDEVALARKKAEDDEALAKEVAAAPVEYHSAMPKLSELDLGLKWARVHTKCAEEGFDMACLTEVLCQQLDDDDVPWNPDGLLVQLTSELLDAAERREELDTASPTTSTAPTAMASIAGSDTMMGAPTMHGTTAGGMGLVRQRKSVVTAVA